MVEKTKEKFNVDSFKRYLKVYFIENKYYYFVVICIMVAYAFGALNRTISVDDLARDYYIGSGRAMLSNTRWGMWLITRVFASTSHVPFIDYFIGVVALTLAGVMLGFFIYVDGTVELYAYPVLVCIFITCPLIIEIWDYSGSNSIIGVEFFIISVALIEQMIDNNSLRKYIVSSGLLAIVAAGYESILFCYVLIVFIILYVNQIDKEQIKCEKWLVRGIEFAIPVVVAIIMRFVIGFSIIKILGLNYNYGQNGATQICWFTDSIKTICANLIRLSILNYFVKGFIYFPIAIFVLSLVIFLVYTLKKYIEKKDINILVIAVLVVFAVFLQALLQGNVMPYRTASTVWIFTPFVAYLLMKNTVYSKWKIILSVLLLLLSYRQSLYIGKILNLNNLRSDNEFSIAREIGLELSRDYDLSKDIVFVGTSNLGTYIEDEKISKNNRIYNYFVEKLYTGDEGVDNLIRRYSQTKIETNLQSLMEWNKGAFFSQKMMKDYFSYVGFDINVIDNYTVEQQDYYEAIAQEKQIRKYQIMDMGDYILVSL